METDPVDDLAALIAALPEVWSTRSYRNRRYGVTKTTHAGGRSSSVYAEELGGTDVVSTNVYVTAAGPVLKPCEMPAATVLAFLRGAVPDDRPA